MIKEDLCREIRWLGLYFTLSWMVSFWKVACSDGLLIFQFFEIIWDASLNLIYIYICVCVVSLVVAISFWCLHDDSDLRCLKLVGVHVRIMKIFSLCFFFSWYTSWPCNNACNLFDIRELHRQDWPFRK